MPPSSRRSQKKTKKPSTRRSRRTRKKNNESRRRDSSKEIHIYHHRPFRNNVTIDTRPHHHHYTSSNYDVHDHLNRVNRGASDELSQQDEIQRQLKKNATNYVPNYMHVSSNEIAIPAPLLLNKMQSGMRVFTSG
jgi:hypothetical protein